MIERDNLPECTDSSVRALTQKLLASYERYYNLNLAAPMPPFVAEATFRIHGEEYFLIKSAKYAEMDSCEHVFFAEEEYLSTERAEELVRSAWEEGLRRTEPRQNHRNTDTILFLICREMDPGVERYIKKTNPHRSYRFGLWGFSNLKLVAMETSGGKAVFNRHGQSLSKLVRNIQKTNEKEKSK